MTTAHTITAQLNVDIAIVGGAMAGATLALGLAKLSATLSRPLRIALIEAHLASNNHPGFDARSIAIAHGSIFELTRLGIWPKLQHLGTAIENIHVSDRGHFGMTELNAKPLGLGALGQVVELAQVGKVLFEQLAKSSVEVLCPATVTELQAQTNGHLLTLDNGTQLHCQLLVAADGANSVVRQHLGQPTEQINFDQTAIVANVSTDQPHQHWAYERFTQTGPLALLPMSSVPMTAAAHTAVSASAAQSRFSVVWALPPAQAEQLKYADKAEFLAALQQAFGHRVGRFVDVGQRSSYPLTLSYMPRPIYHRCIFIGNAAQTLHPIAGQGFNLGLRDVVGLLDVLKQAFSTYQLANPSTEVDVGSNAILHQYLAARQADRDSTLSNIEFLVRGFSNQYWPMVAGRNLGLRLLSWLPPLKRPIAQTAMGWR
ncbi:MULTISPECIES: 2-octaprenyl-6-methoxyphenyl hydroxylase [Shewanella]|uniref:2-octaprenyl-6-methoxyphenyl hydroxylase n=1 Tax=Shewanella TaxID=22 RepID=UPI000C370CE6|nr:MULTISPECIES: 2-octaprenyl-6-methoxyphenyl hydroxylase [Shewanella]NCQ44226.1 2-octaprenyl-6-methoxyphenyl hydroxylase [Shewanella frigidimarina]NCO71153.1 2-octaprenyl-6-methoxyphenyl hydroxylase [Shewanella vesiculosa]NCP35187.1 2-octaprenyl-6-methoxyphenyl hydroxylase [Shewanella vesiculosa]NCP69862.1 2-octaprenyl-6-methoxyphenyl hydroxylase [Shewanella vesiculosa]NCP73231.1 2-octaprenyl-6-methoxyphenyl hydroxylase [Shewanella vesiculosa]